MELLALLPPLAMLLLIGHFGVGALHWDEWGCEVPVLRAYLAGTLDWPAIHAQCNESRPAFSKLIWLFLTLASGAADPRWEMFTGWAIVSATALNLYRLSVLYLSPFRAAWLSVCVNALLFSAVQHENWLWGAQMMLFLPALYLTIWLRIVTSPRTSANLQVAAGALLAILATYSFANGFLLWPALLASLPLSTHFPKKHWRLRAAATWMLALLATLALYFHNYQRGDASPSYTAAIEHPLRAAQYVLIFLGGPFSISQPTLSAVAGLTLLAALAGFVRITGLRTAAPWLILSGYAVASAALAAAGRVALGPQQALESRYVAFAVWLAVGVVSLGFVIQPRVGRVLPAAALALLGILHGLSYAQGVRSMHYRALGLRYHAACLTFLFTVPGGDCADSYPAWSVDLLRESAPPLDQVGWLRPPLFSGQAIPEGFGKFAGGNLELLDPGTSQWQLEGGVGGDPDAVVIAIRTRAGYVPIAVTQATRVVPMRVSPSAWRTLIGKSTIPKGTEVAAFAYRATEPRWLQFGTARIQ